MNIQRLFARSLEDHGLPVTGINASLCQNRRRIDYKNIQMKAALAAAQAEHDIAFPFEDQLYISA